jgi:hypothetical protein
LKGLEKEAPRPGRNPRIKTEKIQAVIKATLHTKPPKASHWSTRSMAEAQELSQATIRRIWKHHGLIPRRVDRSEHAPDKRVVKKLHDVAGLYLNPPDMALVLYANKKSKVEVLDASRPCPPAEKRYGMIRRKDTAKLFAALSLLNGKVFGDGMPRHRYQELIRFLKQVDADTPTAAALHVMVSKYGTHQHRWVQSWLGRHSRFHLHIIPACGSWLGLTERWFRRMCRMGLSHGSFQSVPALASTIKTYIDYHHQTPQIFVWTASMELGLLKAT